MNRIKELRKSIAMQQKELALIIGVSAATVSEWESQKKDPSGERLMKLADLFHVTPLEILSPANVRYVTKMPSDDDLQFALFGGAEEITKEDFEDVKKYAQFIVARKRGLLN